MIFKYGCAAMAFGFLLNALGALVFGGVICFVGFVMVCASVVLLFGEFMP